MPLYTRETLPTLLADLSKQPVQVYFLFGERYLCHNAAGQIETVLLQGGGTVHPIDGDQEDIQSTLSKLRSFSLLPGRQIYRVTDTRLFHSRLVVKNIWDRVLKAHAEQRVEQAIRALRSMLDAGGLDPESPDIDLESMSQAEWQHCFGFARPAGDLSWTVPLLEAESTRAAGTSSSGKTDPAETLTQILAAGIPQGNTLILLSEEADKRKKLFKLLRDEQVVVDLSVETGAGTKAQKEQRSVLGSLVQQTLAEQNKTMVAGLNEILFERVGFHPVAVVMELRKVMLSIGDRRQITRDDLDAMVGRTRQEALFELTSAIANRNLEQTLTIGSRLEENGVHPLAVVSTLRNFVRGLLLCRTLQDQPRLHFSPTMSVATFQQHYLPLLKEREPWKKEFNGHPYALYMQFKTAARYSLNTLCQWMRLLLDAEIRLKGSSIDAALILQHLLLSMLAPAPAR